jgi:hypothetical protein
MPCANFFSSATAPRISIKKKLHRQIGLSNRYENHTKNIGVILGSFLCTSGVIDTAGAKIGDFHDEYLRKFEAICNQGPRWDCLMKKIKGRKSRDTVTLMGNCTICLDYEK